MQKTNDNDDRIIHENVLHHIGAFIEHQSYLMLIVPTNDIAYIDWVHRFVPVKFY